MTNLVGKKILMIIAHQNYQDFEYSEPKEIFQKAGAKVITASSKNSPAKGKLGGQTQVDIILPNIIVNDYDAIIFVGGPGAVDYVGDNEANRIAMEAVSQDKILGAICIAPLILAKAGVLKNKKATVWHVSKYDKPVQDLQTIGAEFIDQDVVCDAKIITANGPSAAKNFGEKIVEMLGK